MIFRLFPKAYDEDDPYCKECLCISCKYFHKNSGDCNEGCYECGGNAHIGDCYTFDKIGDWD